MTTTTAPLPLASERTLVVIGRLMVLTNALIAACAAVLSYDALRLLANSQGVPSTLAWMFPLILDGTIAAASLATLAATLHGQRATYPWLLVLSFTAFSLVGNVLHGQPTPVGWFVAALPPVSFALVWHLLLHHKQQGIVRATEVERAARVAEEREAEKQRRAEERAARASQVPAAPAPRRAPEPSRTPLRVAEDIEPNATAAVPSTGPVRAKVSEALLDQAREIVAGEPGIRAVDLGARLGKSEKTGRNLLNALRAEVPDLAHVG